MLLIALILIILFVHIICLPIQEVTTKNFFPTRTPCIDQTKSQQIYKEQLFIDKFINSIINNTEDLKESKDIQKQFDGIDNENSSNQLVLQKPKRALIGSESSNFEHNNAEEGEMLNVNNEEVLNFDPNYISNNDLINNQEQINENSDFQYETKSFEPQGYFNKKLVKDIDSYKTNDIHDIYVPYLHTDYKDGFVDKAPIDTILIQNDYLLPTFNINDNNKKSKIVVKPNWENENIEPTTYEEDPTNSMYKKYQRYNEKPYQNEAFPYKEMDDPKDFINSKKYGSILDRFNLKIPTINIYTSAGNEPVEHKFEYAQETTYGTIIPSDDVYDKDTQNAIELASMKSLEKSDILAEHFLRNARLKFVTDTPILEVELPNKDIYKQPNDEENKITNDNLRQRPYTSTDISNDRDFFKEYTNKESVLDGDLVTVGNEKQDSDKTTIDVPILDAGTNRNGEFALRHPDISQKKIDNVIDIKKILPTIKDDNLNRLNIDQESMRNITGADEAENIYKQHLIKHFNDLNTDESNKKQDNAEVEKPVKNINPDKIETEINNLPAKHTKIIHEPTKSAKGVKYPDNLRNKQKQKVMQNEEDRRITVKPEDSSKTKQVDQQDIDEKNDHNKWQQLLDKIYKGMQQTAPETSPESLNTSHQSAGKEDNLGDLLRNLETGRKSSNGEDNENILTNIQDDTTNIYRKMDINRDFEYSQDTDLLRKVDHVTRMTKKSDSNRKHDIDDELDGIEREQSDGQFVRSKKYAGDFDDNWESIETKKVDVLNKVDQKKVIDDVIQDLENSRSRTDDNEFRKRDIAAQENSQKLNKKLQTRQSGDENIYYNNNKNRMAVRKDHMVDQKIFLHKDYNDENFDPLAKDYDNNEDLDELIKDESDHTRTIADRSPSDIRTYSQLTNKPDSYDTSKISKFLPGRMRDNKIEQSRFQRYSDAEDAIEALDKIDNVPFNVMGLSNENDYTNYFKSANIPVDSVIEKRLGIFGKTLNEHSIGIKDNTNKLINEDIWYAKDAKGNRNSIKSEGENNEAGISKKRSVQRNLVTETKSNIGNDFSENTKYRILSDNISKRETSSLPDIRMAKIDWKDQGPNSEEINQMSDDEFFGVLDALTPEERTIFEEMAEDYDDTSEEYSDDSDNLAVNEESDINNISKESIGNKLPSLKDSNNIEARSIKIKGEQKNADGKLVHNVELESKQVKGQNFKDSRSNSIVGIDDLNADKLLTVKKESVIDERESKSMPTINRLGDLENSGKLKEVDGKIIEPHNEQLNIIKKSIQNKNLESKENLGDKSEANVAIELQNDPAIPKLDITTQEKAQVKREIYVDNSEQHAIEEKNEFKKTYDDNEDLYPVNSSQESYLVDKIPAGDIKNFLVQDKPNHSLEKKEPNLNSNEKMIKNITDGIATGELKVSGNRSPLDIKVMKNGLGNSDSKNEDVSKIRADSDDESDGANVENVKKDEPAVPLNSEKVPDQGEEKKADDQSKTQVNDSPNSGDNNIDNSKAIPEQVQSENVVVDQVNTNADESKTDSINAIVENDKTDEVNNLDDKTLQKNIEVPSMKLEIDVKDVGPTMSEIAGIGATKHDDLFDKDKISKIKDEVLLSNLKSASDIIPPEHINSENIGAVEELNDQLKETTDKYNKPNQDEQDMSDTLESTDEMENIKPDVLTDEDILETDSDKIHDTLKNHLNVKLDNENPLPEIDNVNLKLAISAIPKNDLNIMPDNAFAWKMDEEENQQRSRQLTQLDIENEQFLDKLKLEKWDIDKSDEVFNNDNSELGKPVADVDNYNQIKTEIASYNKYGDGINNLKKTDRDDVLLEEDPSVSKRMDWLISAKLYDRSKRHKKEAKNSRNKIPPPIPIPIPFPI